jgi:hypothetical protein
MAAAMAMAMAMATAVACERPRQAATAAGAGDAPPAAPAVLLELERAPCRGRCPEYVVSLREDGVVTYTGRNHVGVIGAGQGAVDPAALRGVHDALLAAGVAEADSLYDMDAPRCGSYVPDTPAAVLTVRLNGAPKRIRFEPGCSGVPRYLFEFATRIDSLADIQQWVRRQEGMP